MYMNAVVCVEHGDAERVGCGGCVGERVEEGGPIELRHVTTLAHGHPTVTSAHTSSNS